MSEADFVEAWRRWREHRSQDLRRPDGWLSLVALLWLNPGRQRIGGDPGNALRLPGTVPWLGEIELDAQGRVRWHLPAGSPVRIDGRSGEGGIELRADDSPHPSRIEVGRLRLQLIRRGDALALRVRDPEAEALRRFAGVDCHAPDPRWRIDACWEAFATPRTLPQLTIDGRERRVLLHGSAHLELEGRHYQLLPLEQGPQHLLFAFADPSNGRATYAAGRFLQTALPNESALVLDFNRAFNPPCAFSPFATCPLPPPENRLSTEVSAGELAYVPAVGATSVATGPSEGGTR